MSTNTYVTNRLQGPQREYAELASQHLQHDLTDADRGLLEKAAKKLALHTTVGASIGLGLGLLATFRLRRAGQAIYNAARQVEKPVAIQFKDGHTVPFPDTSDFFRPSRFNQILMGTLFSVAGFFLGGELGLLTGSASASSTVSKDQDSSRRIEGAFRQFRIDVLRKQADDLEKQKDLPSRSLLA